MVVTLGDSLVIAHKNGKLTIADSYPLHENIWNIGLSNQTLFHRFAVTGYRTEGDAYFSQGKITPIPIYPNGDISLDYWSESEDDSSGDGGGLELCIQSDFNKKPIYVYFYVMGVFFGLSTQDLNDAKKLAIENTDKTITLGQ